MRADRLVADALQCEGNRLTLGDAAIDIGHCGKIVVVGGGKGHRLSYDTDLTPAEAVPKVIQSIVHHWATITAARPAAKGNRKGENYTIAAGH